MSSIEIKENEELIFNSITEPIEKFDGEYYHVYFAKVVDFFPSSAYGETTVTSGETPVVTIEYCINQLMEQYGDVCAIHIKAKKYFYTGDGMNYRNISSYGHLDGEGDKTFEFNIKIKQNGCYGVEPVTYTVEFNLNGETCTIAPQKQYIKSGNYVKNPGTISCTNKTVIAWSEDSSGENIFNIQENPVLKNLTLYAVWSNNNA